MYLEQYVAVWYDIYMYSYSMSARNSANFAFFSSQNGTILIAIAHTLPCKPSTQPGARTCHSRADSCARKAIIPHAAEQLGRE